MRSHLMHSFVAAVALAAGTAMTFVSWSGLGDKPVALAALMIIALITGARPVRIPKLKVELVVMELFLFTAMLALAPAAAPLVALASVCGAMFGPRRRPFSIRTVFNIASFVLSAALATLVFESMLASGNPTPAAYGLPLAAAGLVFFLTNTGLAGIVISLHGSDSFFRVWGRSCALTAAPTVTGAVLAVGFASLLIATGPAVLIAGLVVSLPLTAYDRQQALRAEQLGTPSSGGAGDEPSTSADGPMSQVGVVMTATARMVPPDKDRAGDSRKEERAPTPTTSD